MEKILDRATTVLEEVEKAPIPVRVTNTVKAKKAR